MTKERKKQREDNLGTGADGIVPAFLHAFFCRDAKKASNQRKIEDWKANSIRRAKRRHSKANVRRRQRKAFQIRAPAT